VARPPHRLLSRVNIAEAALRVLDEEGTDALTVRRVAERLGVRAQSLYNPVASKDAILDAITEIIDGAIDTAALADPDWRRGLAAFARSYRAAFDAHPNALPLIARRPVGTDVALGIYEAMLAALERAGWSPAEAMRIVGALDYLVLGSAIEPFVDGFTRQPHEYATRHPHLARALAASDRSTLDDDAFELGLELLLSALEQRRTTPLAP
jgi:AcrR family transcriptional regulator